MEQNKTRTYLLYAVGEILLVVIGILIALQVNNWNEENREQIQANILLQSIKSDLQADMIMIDSMNIVIDQQITNFDQLQAQITSTEVTESEIIELIKNEFSPFLGGISGFNDNSYRSASSSGTISYLDAEIREQLYELYLAQSLTMRVQDDYEQQYLNNINEFIAHYPLKLDFVVFNKGMVYEQKWDSPDFDHFTTLFNATGSSWRNFYRIMQFLMEDAKINTESTLSIINDWED